MYDSKKPQDPLHHGDYKDNFLIPIPNLCAHTQSYNTYTTIGCWKSSDPTLSFLSGDVPGGDCKDGDCCCCEHRLVAADLARLKDGYLGK